MSFYKASQQVTKQCGKYRFLTFLFVDLGIVSSASQICQYDKNPPNLTVRKIFNIIAKTFVHSRRCQFHFKIFKGGARFQVKIHVLNLFFLALETKVFWKFATSKTNGILYTQHSGNR